MQNDANDKSMRIDRKANLAGGATDRLIGLALFAFLRAIRGRIFRFQMKARPLAAAFVWLALAGASAQFSVAPEREWSPSGSVPVRASLVSFDGTSVVLRASNGQRSTMPVASLADADRAYLEEWKNSRPITLPDSVGVDSAKLSIDVVKEDDASQTYVYRTPHFEFTSEGRLTQSLLRDIARNFEATYELLKALPWGISPAPEDGDRFRALLVRTRERYAKEGGMPNSGGVYMRSRSMFVVPFESIGLREVGKSFAKSSDYRSDTLVHELTHQMMHAWLDLLPQWAVEGTAEYTNILPLRFGIFRVASAKSGLKDYLDFLKPRGGVPDPYPLEKLLTISPEEWSRTLSSDPKEARRMYFTSYLLVYYFMHLDGKGDGDGFVRYMREVGKKRQAVEDFRKAVEEFKKQPGVEVRADGSYRWPGNLTHPPEPEFMASKEHLQQWQDSTRELLLAGRTVDALAAQIRSAYKRLGVKI